MERAPNNRPFPLQSARAFWDLDDINNEAGDPVAGAPGTADDHDAYFPWEMATGLNNFPAGTANRQNYESDSHGVNGRDYRANNSGYLNSTTLAETLLQHNCIQSQDDN